MQYNRTLLVLISSESCLHKVSSDSLNDFQTMNRKLKNISWVNKRFKQSSVWVLVFGIMAGCSPKEESLGEGDTEGHLLIGTITAVDEAAGLLEVAHEEIPDLMPAMTMKFEVSAGDLKNGKEGQKIRARMIRDENGAFQLIKIWPLDEQVSNDLKRVNQRLQEQAKGLPSGYHYGEGDESPDFALLDQFGEVVTNDQFSGKPLMLNFIFTRCTDANMCPLSTSKMVQLQKLAQASALDVNFVSITLDPQYDTPGVLRQYAEAYGIDGSNFKFVTGPKSAVRDLVKSHGVTSIDKVDTIMHSLATVLIDEDGTIAKRSDKSAWTPEEFLEILR